jgi:aquaporin Z
MKTFVVEAIGTFFLTLVFAMTGDPIAVGAIFAAMIYVSGFAGGHFNPAITMALYMQGKVGYDAAVRFVTAQLLGGFVAAVLYWIIIGNMFVPRPNAAVPLFPVLLTEFLFAFVIALVYLYVMTGKKGENGHVIENQYYGIALGAVLTAAIYAARGVSSGILNPAIAVGPIIFDVNNIPFNFTNLLVYIIGPVAGGALAGYFYKSKIE